MAGGGSHEQGPPWRATHTPAGSPSNPLLEHNAAQNYRPSLLGQGNQAYTRQGERETPITPRANVIDPSTMRTIHLSPMASSVTAASEAPLLGGQQPMMGSPSRPSPPIPAHGASHSPFEDPLIQMSPLNSPEATSSKRASIKVQRHVKQAAGLLGKRPNFHIRVQLAPGAPSKRISSSDVRRVKTGGHLWDNLRSTAITSYPECLEGAHYCLSRGADEVSTNPKYITATFGEDTSVFVLLHSATKVPSWLSERFVRIPDKDVEVEWHFSLLSSVSYFLADAYRKMATSTLKVWYLKDSFVRAGEPLVLGGAEAIGLSEVNYIFCWRKHNPQSVLERQMTNDYAHYSLLNQKALNETLEIAVLSDDIQKVRMLIGKGADVSITVTSRTKMAPRGALLTNAATASQNISMVCCLVLHGAELDWVGLEYVVHQCVALPKDHGPLEAFLVRYVQSHRNPINSCYAIAYSLRSAANRLPAKAKEFRQLSDRFRHSAITLVEELRRLEDFSGTFTHSFRGHLTAGKVLEPTQFHSPLYPINLANTRKISTRMHDTEFTSTSVVQEYIDRSWKGEVYSLMTGDDVEMSTSNNKFIRNGLRRVGFTGALGSSVFGWISQVLHILIFASRSFFNSPRGRWCFRVYTQALFMAVFHLALFTPKGPDRFTCDSDGQVAQVQSNSLASMLAWFTEAVEPEAEEVDMGLLGNDVLFWVLSTALSLWAVGMMVDFYHVLRYQYSGSLRHLLKQGQSFVLFELLLGALLVVSIVLWGATEIQLSQMLNNNKTKDIMLSELCNLPALQGRVMLVYRPMKAVFSTAAFLSWLQTLLVIRPINKNLGPLVYVIGKMLKEVMFFMIPMGILLLGFASALYALFSDQSNETFGWYNFGDVCMFLFQFFVGEFKFDVFYQSEECTGSAITCPDQNLRAFGLVILVMYTILGTILMANLLIAILTYKYDPDTIDAENFFHRQLTLDNYQEQVDNHLLPAPFSPFLVITYQFASGMRRRQPPSSFARWMLPALDGNLLADPKHQQVATGAHEVPYLIFIVWFWPILVLASVAPAVVMMGYAVLHFAYATAVRLDYSHLAAADHKDNQQYQQELRLSESAARTQLMNIGILKGFRLGLGRQLGAGRRRFRPLRMLRFIAVWTCAAVGGAIIYVSMFSLFTVWILLWVMPSTLVFHSFWALSGIKLIPSGVMAGANRMLGKRNRVAAVPRSIESRFDSDVRRVSTDNSTGTPVTPVIKGKGYKPDKSSRAWIRVLEKYQLQRWKVFDDMEVDAALRGQGLHASQLLLTEDLGREIGAQSTLMGEDGIAGASSPSMEVLTSGLSMSGNALTFAEKAVGQMVSPSQPEIELSNPQQYPGRVPSRPKTGLGRVPSYPQEHLDTLQSKANLSIMVPPPPMFERQPSGKHMPTTRTAAAYKEKSPYNMPPKTPKARSKAKAAKGRGQAVHTRPTRITADVGGLAEADPWAAATTGAAVEAAVVEHVAPMQEAVMAMLQSQQQALDELRAEVALLRKASAT